MPFSKLNQNKLSGILIFIFFPNLCFCQKEQLGWRETISPRPLQRPHGNKPGYLDSMSAAKPLLRFLVHFWAEEDFEEGCGRERTAFRVPTSTREALGKKMGA